MNTQVRYSFHSSYAEGELCREAQGHGWLISAFVLCALVMSFSCFADDRTMADDIQAADTTYKFVDERPAGIQQEQFARNLKDSKDDADRTENEGRHRNEKSRTASDLQPFALSELDP